MKSFIKSLRLTLVFCLMFGVCYVLVLWLFAQVASPGGGNAATVTANGKVVGCENVGQQFRSSQYIWGRPSCAGNGYDATSSCGSNKGATDPDYLAEVEARIDTFLAHHPYLKRADVPAEMVTASGSGLDPHITIAAALAQARRVAEARGITEDKVKAIISINAEEPLCGAFGPTKVNVLKLNVALDEACNNNTNN